MAAVGQEEAVLRVMHALFVPLILQNTTWPESTRNELKGGQRFLMLGMMASHPRPMRFLTYALICIHGGPMQMPFPDTHAMQRCKCRAGQLYKFMASLTDHVHHKQGQTVLYVPPEDPGDVKSRASDKGLVRRLEVVVIQWTRQVRRVASGRDSGDMADETGGHLSLHVADFAVVQWS